MDECTKYVLFSIVTGLGSAVITAILGNIFMRPYIRKKLFGFIVYHFYARFFPNKFKELVFYADGTWSKRVDEIPISESLRLLSNAQQKMIKLHERIRQQRQGSDNFAASKKSATKTEVE